MTGHPTSSNDSGMVMDRHAWAAILAEAEPLSPEARATYLRELVVSLLEYLGYTLAHGNEPSLAKSAFILATDVNKRIAWLEDSFVLPQNSGDL